MPTGENVPRLRTTKPQWDGKTGTLFYKGVPILRVRRPCSYQWMLVAAFAQARWPRWVADPLRPTPGYCPERLTQTVKDLNRKQKNSLRVRFTIDADRRSVRWMAVEQ